MISCILLSAGLSSRFGSPKALAKLKNETVIAHLLNSLLKTSIEEIIVVLGANRDEIEQAIPKNKKIKIAYNANYKLGQTSSFQTGLKAVSPTASGILLLPVDCPLIKPDTVNRLLDFFKKQSPIILIPTYQGRRGHPPIFNISLKAEFSNLSPELGLNTIIYTYEKNVQSFSVNDLGVVQSFNTPDELRKIADL